MVFQNYALYPHMTVYENMAFGLKIRKVPKDIIHEKIIAAAEISKLHAKLETTFIYVTHDQVETMTMGSRICVMKNGFIQQVDTPKNLYRYPCNKFVAGFIGTPQMNFFEATFQKEGEFVRVKFRYTNSEVLIPSASMLKVKPEYFDGGGKPM